MSAPLPVCPFLKLILFTGPVRDPDRLTIGGRRPSISQLAKRTNVI